MKQDGVFGLLATTNVERYLSTTVTEGGSIYKVTRTVTKENSFLKWLKGKFTRKKEEKECIERLEEVLEYEERPTEQDKYLSRRGFLIETAKGLGALVATGTVLGGGCGLVCSQIVREVPEPVANMALPEVDHQTHAEQMNNLYSLCEQVESEEGVHAYILEGMILACSEQNSHSLHQREEGLGGVVLHHPLRVGVTQEMLDQDPLISLRLAAKTYKRIRPQVEDDEKALAVYFSSFEKVEEAVEKVDKCKSQEVRRMNYLSDSHKKMIENDKRRHEMLLRREEDMSEERKQSHRDAQRSLYAYPDPELDMMRDHEQNAKGMYYINRLDDFAAEAVKLALSVHPDYKKK